MRAIEFITEAKVPPVRDQIRADIKKNGPGEYFVRVADVDKLGFSARQKFGRSPDMDDPDFDVDYIGAGKGRPALWFYPVSEYLKNNDLYATESPYVWLVKLKDTAWLQPARRGAAGVASAPQGKQRVGIMRHSNPPAAIFFEPGFDVVGKYYDYAGQHKRHGQVKGAPKPTFFDRVRGVTEAFDQPYPMTWEHGDDSHDALAKLSNGTNLSIMFNKDYGDYGDEEWTVEFWRNNSQEVTGEGDQQRVFATVLSAIQQFIETEHPARIRFSANKDVEPGQKSQTRSNLYTKLVRRYANSWGYSVDVDDFADTTVYNLHTLHEDVTENFSNGMKSVVDAVQKVMPSSQEIWFHGSRATGKHRKNSDTDILVVVPDDLVGDQYLAAVRTLQKLSAQFNNYDIQPTKSGTNIHRIAQEEGRLLWSNKQGVAENFDDGKNPGRKGLSRRVGIPKKATLAQLEKIAGSSTGERRRMAQWQLNMRRGKKK